MYRIGIIDDRYRDFPEEEIVLKDAGAELVVLDPDNKKDFHSNISGVDALLVNLYPIDKSLIGKLDSCKVISRYGVGYDNVDVEAATEKGIWVANVPDYSIEDVSDQALALLMGCVRKVAYKDRMVRAGRWNLHDDQPCYRIKERVLGIIGYGAIARRFHQKTSGLGFSKVLVHDPFVKKSDIAKSGAVPADLSLLLEKSDYISLHVPLNNTTKGMIGRYELSKMKKSAILINTSRGPVVKEAELAEALHNGQITGAGLDVFEVEPLPGDSPLRNLDNVILSDHTAWYSEESRVELKTKAALNVISVLKGGRPVYPVNKV